MERLSEKIRTKNELLEKVVSGLEQEGISRFDMYSYLKMDYVRKDVKYYAEEYMDGIDDETAEKAAYLYVYEGKYDCTRSYWANIENVIEKAYEQKYQ